MPSALMRYRVRNEHGELTFQSFDELQDAYVHDMVGPEDEVNEEGSSQWRKAGTLSPLVEARARVPTPFQRQRKWYLLAAALVAGGVCIAIVGWTWISVGLVVFFECALLTWITYTSLRRRR